MKKDFPEKQKKKLIAQRNEILKSLEGKNEQLEKLGETIETGDEVDIATDTVDRLMLNSLGEADQRRIMMINRALDRIAQGTYGRCLICGKEIPEARLRAMPYALMCIKCKEDEERRNR